MAIASATAGINSHNGRLPASDRNFFASRSVDTSIMRAFDFMPVLFLIMTVFVGAAILQFSGSWPDAHRGLLLLEKTCPIHSMR